jgi:MFS family permease
LLPVAFRRAAGATEAGRRVFYGWHMLAGLSAAQAVSWGVLYYTFSVFIRPMEAERGWSRADVAGAFSLALLVSGLAAVPVGRWLDAHGPRALMTAGSLLAVALLLAWSRVTSLAGLYLVWAGLGLAMSMVLYEPAFAVVAVWFVRRRYRALTVLTVCGALASTIFVPAAGALLHALGWRRAVVVLALVLGCTTVPLHALLLRRHPRDVGWEVDGDPPAAGAPPEAEPEPGAVGRAVRSVRFWSLTALFTAGSLATAATGVHAIPLLLERNLPLETATAAVGLIGLMQVPGRLFFAPLYRRLGREGATAAVFLLQAAAVGILPWVAGPAGLALFAAAFGVANGMATLVRASSIAEVFGAAAYGRISGVVALFTTVARAAGPVGVALALAPCGGYPPVFLGLAALLGAASVGSLILGR